MARPHVVMKFGRTWVQEVFGRADPKMRALAEAVAEYQRIHIPVSADSDHGREPGYARDRIQVRVRPGWLGSKMYEVGSDATTPDGFPYPIVLDVGSRPHVIESHGDYPMRDEDGHVYGRMVHHPGTEGNNWCSGSLAAVRALL
jgi:hypothetical protein